MLNEDEEFIEGEDVYDLPEEDRVSLDELERHGG